MAVGLVLSAVFLEIMIASGTKQNLLGTLLFREVVMIAIFYFVSEIKKKNFVYYTNLGLPKFRLLGLCAFYDFVIALITLTPYYAML